MWLQHKKLLHCHFFFHCICLSANFILKKSDIRIRNACDRLLSDVPSDISIEVGETTFALHKFPLVSKSGRIRKQLAESKESSKVHLQDMPGGAEALEVAAKFCYGGNPEITPLNVAMLRCAASYLEMTDHYTDSSLETRTETFLKESVFPSLPDSVTVLYTCESLLPFAEDLKIITRCTEAITSAASNEQLRRGLSRLTASGNQSQWPSSQDPQNQQSTKLSSWPSSQDPQNQQSTKLSSWPSSQDPQNQQSAKPSSDSWWGKELAVLNIHMFQRVVTAMKSKGLGNDIIGGALMHYAKHNLEPPIPPTLDKQSIVVSNDCGDQRSRFKSTGIGASTLEEREKRCVVETVVSLLPPEMKTIPMSFISWLLRAATMLNIGASFRTELERRFGRRLQEASVEDLLLPAYSSYKYEGHTLYDTDVVLRILGNFLGFLEEEEEEEERVEDGFDSDGMGFRSPGRKQNGSVLQVCKLVDDYVAEVAGDWNLSVGAFTALVEAVPEHARIVHDGLYRAIDIFLKAHPTIKDAERNKLCKLLDCQKLSHEACTHAAQNERLPVQLAIQVLYFEQLKLRSAMNADHHHHYPHWHPHHPHHSEAPSATISPRDNYASVRRENRELKLEVTRMRIRLTDLEKDHVSMKQELVKPTPTHKLLHSFSKKMSKLNSLFRSKDNATNPLLLNHNHNNALLSRRRRHSVS